MPKTGIAFFWRPISMVSFGSFPLSKLIILFFGAKVKIITQIKKLF
jgi:hypothetical protein